MRPFPRRQEYLEMLEEYKKELEEELKEVEKEIEDLKKGEGGVFCGCGVRYRASKFWGTTHQTKGAE